MMHGLSSCGSGALEGEDSVVVAQGLSSPSYVGSQVPDQGLSPCPLHCKVDSESLDTREVPKFPPLSQSVSVACNQKALTTLMGNLAPWHVRSPT